LQAYRVPGYYDSLDCEFLWQCPWLSTNAKDFTASLLRAKPGVRMGAKGGFNQIKSHRWLQGFRWDKLVNLSMKVNYKPVSGVKGFCGSKTLSPSLLAMSPDVLDKDMLKILSSHVDQSALTKTQNSLFIK
jgi:hypothetical protein